MICFYRHLSLKKSKTTHGLLEEQALNPAPDSMHAKLAFNHCSDNFENTLHLSKKVEIGIMSKKYSEIFDGLYE